MKFVLPKIKFTQIPKLYFYFWVFVVLCIIFFIGQRVFFAAVIPWRVNSEIERQRVQRNQSNTKYQQIIFDQLKTREAQATTSPQDSPLRGNTNITIVLVKPPSVSNIQSAPLITMLRRPDTDIFSSCTDSLCQKNISLAFIPTFIKNEASKYNITDANVTLDIRGVYTLPELTQVGDFANLWNKDPFGVAKVQDAFEELLMEQHIDSDSLTIFLYFDDSLSPPLVESGSFYDYKKFRSFANQSKKRAYVNVYNFSPQFSDDTVLVVTHELLHLFGASDKYINEISSKKLCTSRGLGDPNKSPLFPQTTGDIMCLFIETNDGSFSRGSLLDQSLIINSVTAREIGWQNN